ncbi:MAG: alpha-ketoglutarate-dependent dioxygenase AlkB family protein [Candidatus Latescibacterota bacterium]|jgi:alkylated DNA repair dioxygenase AlkB
MTTYADADILHSPSFLSPTEAEHALVQLRDETAWGQHVIQLFGRPVNAPRLSSWHGDADARYTYSGLQLEPQPWTPLLASLRQRISTELATPLNSALLNYYRDGRDSMGWHSDDETELGDESCIVSLSLGARRRFLLRHKSRKELDTLEFQLGHGDLLAMRGSTQHYWKHQVPKTQRPVGERINITFRHLHSRET